MLSAAIGLAVALLGTPLAIRAFRRRGYGQEIREDGPESHLTKRGTPTMGGSVIIAGTVAGYLLGHVAGGSFSARGMLVILVMVGLGIVGFIDDFLKVRHQRNLGLNKTAKIIGQVSVAVLLGYLAVHWAGMGTQVSFVRQTGLTLGWLFYFWVVFMVSAASNGVNLTDGLDGLACGSAAMVLGAYVIIAFWQFRHFCGDIGGSACYAVPHAQDISMVAAAGLGACAGFLWWNAAPARIFMGDTGSLALGGGLAALAIVTDTQLLLLVLGGLYVMETISVILQIVSFRAAHRRVFKMAPIHHHFELLGWPEFTVIVRFWIVAGLAVALGLGLFYGEFLARGGA